jgi:hypothetical protein
MWWRGELIGHICYQRLAMFYRNGNWGSGDGDIIVICIYYLKLSRTRLSLLQPSTRALHISVLPFPAR